MAKEGSCVWLATTPGKRWTEVFFLYWSVVWISAMAYIVASSAYETFEENEYMAVGLSFAVPCFVGPLLLPGGQGEPTTPILQRFWVKANLWIWILSFIGNYFWTHYFYNILGAAYTFKAWRLNDVPFALFLITHAYFSTYHTGTTIILRRFWTSKWYAAAGGIPRAAMSCLLVGALAYFTAFAETLTISSFPYYTIKNRPWMYKVGSVFYGLYFIVSFPMYYRLGERAGGNRKSKSDGGLGGGGNAEFDWSLERVAIDSLGACMIVTCLLDFWRLAVGVLPWLASGDVTVKNCVPFL